MNLTELGVGGVHQSHAENGSGTAHGVARVDFDAAAAADDDDAAELRKKAQVLGEVHVGEHFEDEIDAAAAGQVHELLREVGGVMIERVVRALLYDEPTAFV